MSSVHHINIPLYDILLNSVTLFGALIDNDASNIIIGTHQACLYCESTTIPQQLQPSRVRYHFGDSEQSSLGTLLFRILTDGGHFIFKDMHLVPTDTPFLLPLDVIYALSFVLNTVETVLERRRRLSDSLSTTFDATN